MTESDPDIWSRWHVHGRADWSEERRARLIAYLGPIRDKVLAGARLEPGNTLLDVGSGDGLISFGALNHDPTIQVIFSDVSQDLLDRSRRLAEEAGVEERCRFIHAPAHDLATLADESVDVVTTRSVLIYVEDKARALAEFHRVLKPAGRLSIFEPINRFGWPEKRDRFWCYDVTPVMDLAEKVKALYRALQPIDSDPMMNFDERDLMSLAEAAGFSEVSLRLEARVGRPIESHRWDEALRTAPNPKIPCLEEALARTLNEEEAARFQSHLKAQIEAGRARVREALAYLRAVR